MFRQPFPHTTMDTNTTFMVIAVVIAIAIATIGFDRFLHNRERPTFALGIWISTFAVCGIIFLVNGHNNLTHKASALIFFALLIIGLAGNILVDKNNIDDQLSGRMSGWGTWWDGWNNNYVNNVVDRWESWALIIVLGFVMVNIASKNESIQSSLASTSVAAAETSKARVTSKTSNSKLGTSNGQHEKKRPHKVVHHRVNKNYGN